MNSKNITYIKTLATLSLILQGLAVLMSLLVVTAQHSLASLMMSPGIADSDVTVYPPTLIFKDLVFVLFFIFFRMALVVEKRMHRTAALLLIILFLFFDVLAIVVGMVSNYYYASQGEISLVMYSTVSQLISYGTIIFEIPAAPLFFIAYGRYAAQASFTESLPAADTSSLENI